MSVLDDKQLDLSFVLGTGWLREACFGKYTVILRFHTLEISITAPCDIIAPDGTQYVCDPELDSGNLTMFAGLLESEIQSYRVTERPSLVLEFSNGWQLALVDKQDGNESFVLYTSRGTFLAV